MSSGWPSAFSTRKARAASCIDGDVLRWGRAAGGGRGRAPPGGHSARGCGRSVLMNAGEPLKEVEAEQMTKEADKGGDGTINYEGE